MKMNIRLEGEKRDGENRKGNGKGMMKIG